MEIRFSKYHGCGNSFVIIKEQGIPAGDHSRLALEMCSESKGIGADGLIIARAAPQLEMVFYNRDGSRAPMCGNGIRCFAVFCIKEGMTRKKKFKIKTMAGIMEAEIKDSGNDLEVEINMGPPGSADSHGSTEKKEFLFYKKLKVSTGEIYVRTLFMGTLHTVIWAEEYPMDELKRLCAEICSHRAFSEKTNVDIVRILDRKTLEMFTYERGAGFTPACGTGACAAVAAGIEEGKMENKVDVFLPGGKLHIEQRKNKEIFMKGPAVFIACGLYRRDTNDTRLHGGADHTV